MATAATLGFDVWTKDVKQAYLQPVSALKRNIFVKQDEFALGKDEFVQLVLPLYGLSESGDYWSRNLIDHCISKVGFRQSSYDLNLLFRRVGQDLVALSGTFVDDLPWRAFRMRLKIFHLTSWARNIPGMESVAASSRSVRVNLRDSLEAAMKDYINRLTCLPSQHMSNMYRSRHHCSG